MALDLATGGEAPPGVAHDYTRETARAVVAALDPPGWGPARTEQLQAVVDATRPPG